MKACALLLLATIAYGVDLPYWIEPRAGGDGELAKWALQAWERASNGSLHFVPAPTREKAVYRVLWVTGRDGLYGEARPITVDGRPGAELHIRPEMDGLGPEMAAAARKDPLLRDAIVYLTCLHESGHGLGLPHTAAFEDIMYNFGHGGDINEYFARYRRQLMSRSDIARRPGLSNADESHIRTQFGPLVGK